MYAFGQQLQAALPGNANPGYSSFLARRPSLTKEKGWLRTWSSLNGVVRWGLSR